MKSKLLSFSLVIIFKPEQKSYSNQKYLTSFYVLDSLLIQIMTLNFSSHAIIKEIFPDCKKHFILPIAFFANSSFAIIDKITSLQKSHSNKKYLTSLLYTWLPFLIWNHDTLFLKSCFSVPVVRSQKSVDMTSSAMQ